MKYYVLDGCFLETRPQGAEFKNALDAHHEYLLPYIESGAILFSGPKIGGGGGFFVMKCDDDFDIEKFCAEDPMVTSGVQIFKISQFKSLHSHPLLEGWFE